MAVESEPGVGSTFTFFHPIERSGRVSAFDAFFTPPARPIDGTDAPRFARLRPPAPEQVDDDRDDVRPQDRVVLIIEDDTTFARILLDSRAIAASRA